MAGTFSNVSEHDLYGPWYNDHIRTASLTADYRLQDRFGGTNYATLTFRQGLDVFGASHFDDDLLSRDGASSNFSVLNLWFTRYQTLNDAWSLKLSAASQTASRPLFTSQQFYLGGAAFGRGYGAAEISGDNGLAGSLEVALRPEAQFPLLERLPALRFRRRRRSLERRLPAKRRPGADVGRCRRAVLPAGGSPGGFRRGRALELPGAGQ